MAGRKRSGFGKRIVWVGLVAMATGAIGFVGYRAVGHFGSARRLARVEALYEQGEWADASRVAEELLKTEPENHGAALLLARSFARSGRDDLALDVYRRFKADDLKSEDHLLIGNGLSNAGQTPRAVASWLDAERLDPDEPEVLARLASYYHKAKMPVEALPRAEKLARDPRLGLRGAWLETRIFNDLDEPESASGPIDRVRAADASSLRTLGIDRAEVVETAARIALRLGRPERALEALELAPGATPSRESQWLASRALLQQGKAREAETALAAVDPAEPPMRREPAPYAGAESCRPCHASNYASEQSSRHALTFSLQWDGPTDPKSGVEIADPAWRRVRHRLTTDGDATSLETTVADRTYRAIVQYIVGSGEHGQTPMLKDEHGAMRESRVSYYPKRSAWSKTIDHPDAPPEALDYLGRRVSDDAAWLCVDCHTTTASSVLNPSFDRPHDRGIGCERCHGPGGNHLKAIALEFSDPSIVRPSLATAAEVTKLCAECHREAAPGTAPGSPRFIRFQAPTFMKSRCYTESDTFSCVTCHDPHKNAVTEPAHYEAVCLDCHSSKKPDPNSSLAAEAAKARAICPVNPTKGCLNCHMPKVPEAVPHANFTDHFIRVRNDAGAAPPRTAGRE